jgi:hypothetical protein
VSGRVAFVLLNAIAAWCIATAASSLLWILKVSRDSPPHFPAEQMAIVVPAMLAAVVAAMLWTRKPGWWRMDGIALSGFIVVSAQIAVGFAFGALLLLSGAMNGANAAFGFFELAWMTLGVSALVSMAGLIVAGVPAILVECLLIRFVRKRWSPALARGVSP